MCQRPVVLRHDDGVDQLREGHLAGQRGHQLVVAVAVEELHLGQILVWRGVPRQDRARLVNGSTGSFRRCGALIQVPHLAQLGLAALVGGRLCRFRGCLRIWTLNLWR